MNLQTAVLLIASASAATASGAEAPCDPMAGRWQRQDGGFQVLFEVSSDGSRVIGPEVSVYPLKCDPRYPNSAWRWGTPANIAPGNCTCTFVGICDRYGAGAELVIRFVSAAEARVDFEYRNEIAQCASCMVVQDLAVQPVVAVETHAWSRLKVLYR